MELVRTIFCQRFLLCRFLIEVRRTNQFERVHMPHDLIKHFVAGCQPTENDGGFDGMNLCFNPVCCVHIQIARGEVLETWRCFEWNLPFICYACNLHSTNSQSEKKSSFLRREKVDSIPPRFHPLHKSGRFLSLTGCVKRSECVGEIIVEYHVLPDGDKKRIYHRERTRQVRSIRSWIAFGVSFEALVRRNDLKWIWHTTW